VMAGTVAVHRLAGTLERSVSRYIALNEFSRDIFIRGGFPPDRIVVKPNFVAPPAQDDGAMPASGEPRFLYVGRLSEEKGCEVLAAACAMAPGLKVDVVGEGPLAGRFAGLPGVVLHGWRSPGEVMSLMRRSHALVLPSICYENFPRTLVEAYACGLPVIASRLGAMQLLVREGSTGSLFEAGDAAGLAAAMQSSLAALRERPRLSAECRAEYDRLYRPEQNLAMLLRIYEQAIAERPLA